MSVFGDIYARPSLCGLDRCGERAAAAIVLGYGVLAAFLGLVASVFIGWKLSREIIIRLKLVLALAVAGSFGYLYISYQQRQGEKQEQGPPETEQRQPTAPTAPSPREAAPNWNGQKCRLSDIYKPCFRAVSL